MSSKTKYLVVTLAFSGSGALAVYAQTGGIVFEAPDLPKPLAEDLKNAVKDFARPESRLEARRNARRGAKIARSLLNSQAYFSPQIDMIVDTEAPYQTQLRILPGPQYSLGTINYDYAEPQPEPELIAQIASNTQLTSGSAAIPEMILVERQRLKTAYLQKGYADIIVSEPDLLADTEESNVDLTFPVKTGPRILLGDLQVTGAEITRLSFINRLSIFAVGDTYSPDPLANLQRRLSSTRHFRDVSVLLAETDPNSDTLDQRDVIVTLEERPANTIALGASASTDQGFGALVEWTRWNLTGRADPLSVQAQVTQIEQTLGLDWQLPHFPKADRQLALQLDVFNENTDAFDRTGLTFGSTYQFTRARRNTFWTFGAEYELAQERGEAEQRLLQTVSLATALRIDQSNSETNPSRGWRATLTAQPGISFGSGGATFLRNNGQVAGYLPLSSSGDWLVASRLEFGAIVGAANLSLPVDQRFFSGGGASVRGFGFQEVGPRNEDGNPIGGRSLFETSAELRGKITRNIGFATFLDAGSISTSVTPEFDNTRIGVGAGLRYDTPVGPIRIDVGVPINPTEFDSGFQVYFAIGQAF